MAGALKRRLGSDAFLEALPIGIYCCDADGVIRQFNRRAAEIWGVEPRLGDSQQRYCGSHRLFWPNGEPLARDQTPMAEVLRTGKPLHAQRAVVERPDGSRLTALVNIEPLFDEAGQLVGAVNCFQDISDLAGAETRLREREQHVREVLEALPAAIYTTDAQGRITFCNDAAIALAGRRPVLGSDEWCVTWRLYRPDGTPLPHDQCPMAVALKENRPVRGEEAIAERPDGSRVRFVPFPTPLYDAEGRLAGAVNLLVDVTEQREAEEQSAHLAAIVASSDDAIVSKTLKGRVRSWNAAASRIFGYSAEEMIGQPILRLIPPELQSEEDEILARLRRGERVEHFETQRVRKDGQRIDISLTISPVLNKAGQVIGASKVARDISERKQAEALQQLLTSELSHRVKNTLATVQAMASQTVRRAASPAEFATSFSGRLQSLARAHDMLTQSAWTGADLAALARDQLVPGGPEMGRIAFAGPQVMLEPQAALHLALVLHELGTNARKHGALSVPQGRVALHWEVRRLGDPTRRELRLHWQESDGPQVSVPSVLGFGTMLIEKSLHAHGGGATIHYRAEGVACDITLPLAERGAAGAFNNPSRDAAFALPAAASSLAGRRVLVVEDEPLIALDVATTFEDAGCVVVGPAATLEQAKSLIATAAFDAALIDANLAGQPVDELAAALAARNIPFVFVSGYGRQALPAAHRHRPLIGKPFVPRDAIEVVGQLLEADARVVSLRPKSHSA